MNSTVDSPAPRPFKYLALDNQQRGFRVLELLKGGYNDPIVCLLHLKTRDEAPAYEALSYVWGDPEVTANICINGEIFAVTINLEAFLRQIRLPGESRVLWVDALCINQQDKLEKTHQVHMMGSIYRNCQRALLWLGDFTAEGLTAGDVRTFFDSLEYIAGVKKMSEHDWTKARLGKFFETMKVFGHSPWWQRIWTLQEALLPSTATVVWGSQSCLWSTVERAGLRFVLPWRLQDFEDTSFPATLPYFDEAMLQILNDDFLHHVSAIRLTRRGENPLHTFWRFRGRMATDPRDKVFGLLGIYSEQSLFQGLSSENDYHVDAATIFARTTVEFIKSSKVGLKAIIGRNNGAPQLHPKATPGVPSWAVDWVNWGVGDSQCKIWDHIFSYDIYNCGNGSKIDYTYQEEDLSLTLTGLRVDTIATILPIRMEGAHTSAYQILALVRQMKTLHDFNLPYITGGRWAKAFWRTLIGDLFPIGQPSRSRWATKADVAAFQRRCTSPSADEAVCQGLMLQLDIHSFFITSSGYLGVGPKYTSVGDELWVLMGGRTPFVLRPDARGKMHYTLVGDCYAHGLMKGEAFSGTGPKREIEEVTLH